MENKIKNLETIKKGMKSNNKRIASLAIVAAMGLSFAGCSKSDKISSSDVDEMLDNNTTLTLEEMLDKTKDDSKIDDYLQEYRIDEKQAVQLNESDYSFADLEKSYELSRANIESIHDLQTCSMTLGKMGKLLFSSAICEALNIAPCDLVCWTTKNNELTVKYVTYEKKLAPGNIEIVTPVNVTEDYALKKEMKNLLENYNNAILYNLPEGTDSIDEIYQSYCKFLVSSPEIKENKIFRQDSMSYEINQKKAKTITN